MFVGLDEVGYGSWAGPVVAAAVAFGDCIPAHCIALCKDSKKLSAQKRMKIFSIITPFILFGIGESSVHEIDSLNIRQATFLAMHRAINRFPASPSYVFIDGNQDPKLHVSSKLWVKGDEEFWLIAAASIVAKIYRDNFMIQLHKQESRYNFHEHKGYGTIQHRMLLETYGPCVWHRRSFAPIKKIINCKNK